MRDNGSTTYATLPWFDQDDTDFAAEVRIDGARRVDDADAVLERQARARANLSLVAFRDLEDQPGRDQPPFARLDAHGFG